MCMVHLLSFPDRLPARVFVPDFLSRDLTKKRLAERLTQAKLLIIIEKNADPVASPGRRAVLQAGRFWLTVQSGNIFNGL